MRRVGHVWPRVAVAGLVAMLAACGSDGVDHQPPTASQPDPCIQTTVEQDDGPIDPSTLLFFDFSVPDSGLLDVTLDWTLASSPVGFYLVPANTCTLDEFNSRSCSFLIRSEPANLKPKRISKDFSAGNYRWLVANFASDTESISLRIVLAKGDCPGLFGGGAPGAATAAAEAQPGLRRMHRR